MISYKYICVICTLGHYFDAIIYDIGAFILSVVIFVNECSWIIMEPMVLLCCYDCAIFCSGVCFMLTNSIDILSWRKYHLLFLHSFLSHMSIIYVALWFNEKWNIYLLLSSSHWWLHQWNWGSVAPIFIGFLPNLFNYLTHRHFVTMVYVC